jgi:peptidoglycan hydrolase-like protein with peptidoglycan-binding domain
MGTFTIEGTAKGNGANAVLAAIAQEAAKSTPYNVTIFSGKRNGGGSSMHDRNQAVDIVLTDPATGAEIPNLKSSIGFPIYEAFAAQMRAAQMKVAPQYANSFRWGGWFGSSKLNPGGVDLMHFDLKSSRLMAGGDWKNGTYGSFRKYIASLGAGMIYSAKGQRAAVRGGVYPNLWGEAVFGDSGVPLPRLRPDYDPNNPRNLRPPADIPSPSDLARAYGESRAEADRKAILARQPPGEQDAKAPDQDGRQTGRVEDAERRIAGPMPRARPALVQAQKAILGNRANLRKGTYGSAAVAEVQKFLNDQGYTDAKGRALKVDGDLGVRTRQAIIAYQQDRGLRPDGVVGIKTLADMAAVQEQADNPVIRGQSPEMGGDRFDVAQIIEGPAPGLPGGGIGSDFATSMGARLAVNMNAGVTTPTSIAGEPFGPALAVQDYTPDPGNSGFGDFVRNMVKDAFDAPPASADPFANASPYAPSLLRPDLAPLESGVQDSAGHYFDNSVHFENADPYEGPGLSADALQFQADLTPSLGGALGSSLGGGGGTVGNVLNAFGRTARELAAMRAEQAGRAIQVASADPFAAYKASALAQSNAQTQAFLAAAGAASAALGTSSGTSPGGFNPGINSSPGNNSRASGTDSPGAGSTSPGTSPSVGGSRPSNTVSNPGSLGGSSTSPGTSSTNRSGGSNTSAGTSRF